MTSGSSPPDEAPHQPLGHRLRTLVVGHTGNAFIGIGFDYLIYGTTIAVLGPIKGGLLMIAVSFLLDLLLIRFYDWSKTDWLGIEALKAVRDGAATSSFQRTLQWILRKGDAVALVALSFKLNPFNVMLYLRHGAHLYNGMSRRDWLVLIASTLIGNVYWILVMWGATSGLMHLWTTWVE